MMSFAEQAVDAIATSVKLLKEVEEERDYALYKLAKAEKARDGYMVKNLEARRALKALLTSYLALMQAMGIDPDDVPPAAAATLEQARATLSKARGDGD